MTRTGTFARVLFLKLIYALYAALKLHGAERQPLDA